MPLPSIHEEKNFSNVKFVTSNVLQKGTLNRHVSSVHERKKPFKCELCEKSFAVIPYMRNHFARIHKGEQHGICKICEYICSSKYTWNKSILNLFMKKSHFSVKCVNETSHGVFI